MEALPLPRENHHQDVLHVSPWPQGRTEAAEQPAFSVAPRLHDEVTETRGILVIG